MNISSPRLAYKYRSGDSETLERDLQTLRDATFYAAKRDKLNDPFEGRFNRTELDAQLKALCCMVAKEFPKISGSVDGLSEAVNEALSFVDTSGVFSLSCSPLSELVWAHYGGSHRGFCVGYDLQKLTEFEPNSHYCFDVQYHCIPPTLRSKDLIGLENPLAILQALLGVKSKPWLYEDEVRVVTSPQGTHEHDYRAVKRVYFGLRCPESTQLAVMEALAGRGVMYEQIESPDNSYALQSRSIQDAFASAPKYRVNFAPIQDGAIYPDGLNPDQMQHCAYLYKAAEIVRRDPYCHEITNVDFSVNKSTHELPVIYVQYLRGPDKRSKQYLTLSEIDKQYADLGLAENVASLN